MQPTLLHRPALRVVGMAARYRPGRIEGIPAQWERFANRNDELPDAVPDVSYGVSFGDGRPGDPGFVYFVCREVPGPGPVPDGMEVREIPAGTYARFTHRGPISKFGETMRVLWNEWIPASGLKPSAGPMVEVYDVRFAMEEPDSEVDVWVAVEG